MNENNNGVRFLESVNAICEAINSDNAYKNRSEMLSFILGYLTAHEPWLSALLAVSNDEEGETSNEEN